MLETIRRKYYLSAVIVVSLAACSPADTQNTESQAAAPAAAPAIEIPRGPDGKPDLNGIWQVLSTANNNLEAAPAKAAPAKAARPARQDAPKQGSVVSRG